MITPIQLPNTNLHALKAGPESSDLPPVILVHGAFCDGRMWRGNFLEYVAKQGHPTYAIHLKDPNRKPIRTLFSYSLKAYALRLRQWVEYVGKPPILIGHSMGGLVIQKYLSLFPGTAVGAGLLASLPPFGMKNTLLGMLKAPDLLLTYLVLTFAPTLAQRGGKEPRGLLSDRVLPEQRRRFSKLLVQESMLALTHCVAPGIDQKSVAATPLQIWGAELDNLALPKDVQRMAELYGVEAQILPNTGHFLVYEPEWEEIAASMREAFWAG
ncbi:MAG: alpha/beta hydrolase [Bacteroidota bacterium]